MTRLHIALLAALTLLLSCGPGSPAGKPAAKESAASSPLTVVCTIGMITDIVRAVAGDRAQVSGLMGEGVDPHLYKPTRTDIGRLMSADLVFYNGLLLEGRASDALIRAASSGRRVYAVTELLDEEFLLEPEHFEGHFDPHVWMDPIAWRNAVEVVRDRLAEADPAGAETYRQNASAYLGRLNDLDAYCRSVLSRVPEAQRILVTAHDAFNYFGRRYGFEVVGIQGISTESEAGVRDIEQLVNLIVDKRIGAVFVESTVSDRNVNALIAGAQARGHSVVIGGSLYSDAMGTADTYEGSYIGMIDHNVTTIARALGGQAPERGMSGRLNSNNTKVRP